MKRDILLACVVLAVVAYVALWEGCFGACSYITDSVYYMRFAERMLGNGVDDGWFATWPVGYPAVLSAVRGITGIDVFVASKLVGIGACAALLLIYWKFAKRAFPILSIGLLNLAFLKIWRSTLSEQCFIPVFVLLGFVVSGEKDMARIKRISLWATLFVMAFMFRYVGVFAPVWAVGAVLFSVLFRPAVRWHEALGRDRRWLADVSFAGCAAWIIEGVYLLLNRLNAGCVTGMDRVDMTKNDGMMITNMVSAYAREAQAFVLLSGWLLLLCLLARGVSGLKKEYDGRNKDCIAAALQGRRVLFFVGMGVMYLLTMAALRVVANFNELGFRMLYPGTIMIVVGVSIGVAELFDVDAWLCSLNRVRYCAYLAILLAAGCNLLSGELAIRRFAGIDVYGIGEPYRQKKRTLMEKYGAMPCGSTLQLQGLGDSDFFVGCLRPDLFIEFPEGCKRY